MDAGRVHRAMGLVAIFRHDDRERAGSACHRHRAVPLPEKELAKIVLVVLAAAAAYLLSGHGGEAASMGVALAGVLVLLYNGERGPGARWFYLFYPAHMLILGVWNLLC